MNFLTDLNPMQQQAVKAINGPVLVVAGAGSGKTKVLTYRIAYLIEQGIAPQNILAVTFTNKAAEEMRQRVIKLISAMATLHPRGGATQEDRIGINALRQNIGTFHSICARILRHEISALGYKPSFTIYDDSDQNDLIKHLTKEANLDKQQFKPGMIREIISSAKDELLDPNQFREKAKNYIEETISQIYQAYQARLKMANSLDFDDLIFLTVKLFQFKPEVLARYQNYWQYIL
ncbi:MAG: ATP-dependent DNA helicase PcrA, partial [Candidatus Portnoybacteria bacterium CG06_land_8_20_14_3_00_39_12]